MTVDVLVQALAQRCQEALEGLELPVQPGEDGCPALGGVHVYQYQLPPKTAHDTGDTDRRAPYLLIQPTACEDSTDDDNRPRATSVVRIFACTWGDDAAQAQLWLTVCLERLRASFLRHPVIGRQFRVLRPLGWLLYNQDSQCYALGEMDLTLLMPSIREELAL